MGRAGPNLYPHGTLGDRGQGIRKSSLLSSPAHLFPAGGGRLGETGAVEREARHFDSPLISCLWASCPFPFTAGEWRLKATIREGAGEK